MKGLKAILCIAVMTGLVLWLLPELLSEWLPSEGGVLARAEGEFRQLALTMTLIRLFVVTVLGVFCWKPITKLIARYFSVDVSARQGRVLIWYLAVETVILSSVWGGP